MSDQLTYWIERQAELTREQIAEIIVQKTTTVENYERQLADMRRDRDCALEANRYVRDATLVRERARKLTVELAKERARFDWFFSPDATDELHNRFLVAVRAKKEGWTVTQWRSAIDDARGATTATGEGALVRALRELIGRIDEVRADSRYKGIWECFANHGGKYLGPNFDAELFDARAALSAYDARKELHETTL